MRRLIPLLLLISTACEPPADGEVDSGEGPRAGAREPVTPRDPEGRTAEYTLRFDDAHTHRVAVEAVLPTGGDDTVTLMMPVWTPGSYLVREYARHVEDLTATTADGLPLSLVKTTKNRWQVSTDGADPIVLRYGVYAHERSVRTNFVDADLASLNGAPTFITVVDALDRPCDVELEPREGWERCVTGLDRRGDGARFVARDYHELVDSPIVCGSPAVYDFDVEGVPHSLATFEEGEAWQGERAARDVETLVRAQVRFWRVVPYDR